MPFLKEKYPNEYDAAVQYFNSIKEKYLQKYNANGTPKIKEEANERV